VPTYVINLKSSYERRVVMRDHLEAVAVPFQFFDAVDGREITHDALLAMAPKGGVDYCGMLTAAEIGCALSHLGVIRQIAEGKGEYGAVLEDDVFLLPEGRRFFDQEFLRSLPAFDILQLASVDRKHRLRRILNIGHVDGYQFCASPRCHYSMRGLIYTREAARLIAAEIKKITAPIDNMIFYDQRVMGLRVIEVHPVLLRSNVNVPSDIGSRHGPDRLLSKADRELRRFRNLTRRWRSFARVWGLSSIIHLSRPDSVQTPLALGATEPGFGTLA
jgi:GR25 family glycosyltransferase involved in LPS biosynthesis